MKRILFLLLFVGFAYSCEKEYYTTIPNMSVYIELWIETRDSDLKANLAYKTITQPRTAIERTGFGGILIINGMGEAPINLYAYDLSCPVESERSIRVVPDKSGVTATCPKCGAVYTIATGTGAPQSGTKYLLKSYRVSESGAQYTVYN